jgi:hypothetical protein
MDGLFCCGYHRSELIVDDDDDDDDDDMFLFVCFFSFSLTLTYDRSLATRGNLFFCLFISFNENNE